MSNKFSAIPEPGDDIASLKATIRALKQVVEQSTTGSLKFNRNHVTTNPPTNPTVGDLWVGPTRTVYWTGKSWETLP